MMKDKFVLLDTNVILRSKQPESVHYTVVVDIISNLLMEDTVLVLAPQTLYEFYAVATRSPESNGLGLAQEEALQEVINLQDSYVVLPENEKILNHWISLLQEFEIKGKTIHDSRLVAYMLSHEIEYFYTLNKKDFSRYEHQQIIKLI